MDIVEFAATYDSEMKKIDGFDDCCLGAVSRFGSDSVLIYDRAKIISKLGKDMSLQDAEEYFEYNIAGAWVGQGTPAFLERIGD